MAQLLVALLVFLASTAATGCMAALEARPNYAANPQTLSLSPFVTFQGTTGPLSYQTAVGADGQRLMPARRVRKRVCQRGIELPVFAILGTYLNEFRRGPGSLSVGWGDGSYQAALDQLRSRLPAGAVLYDLRADLNHRAILTVYREQCLVIDAGVLVPAPSPLGSSAPPSG